MLARPKTKLQSTHPTSQDASIIMAYLDYILYLNPIALESIQLPKSAVLYFQNNTKQWIKQYSDKDGM